jgi:hypothetical protein
LVALLPLPAVLPELPPMLWLPPLGMVPLLWPALPPGWALGAGIAFGEFFIWPLLLLCARAGTPAASKAARATPLKR